MRHTSESKVLKYNSMFLGTTIFIFGFLKFFEPFHNWLGELTERVRTC
jgi:hypothetical protein